MVLGLLSISLKVADIAVSKAFYEKLGFEPVEGTGPIEDNGLLCRKGIQKSDCFRICLKRILLHLTLRMPEAFTKI
jgi:hypothetical protein